MQILDRHGTPARAGQYVAVRTCTGRHQIHVVTGTITEISKAPPGVTLELDRDVVLPGPSVPGMGPAMHRHAAGEKLYLALTGQWEGNLFRAFDDPQQSMLSAPPHHETWLEVREAEAMGDAPGTRERGG